MVDTGQVVISGLADDLWHITVRNHR